MVLWREWLRILQINSSQFLLVPTTAHNLGPLCIFALASVRGVDPFYGCSAAAAAGAVAGAVSLGQGWSWPQAGTGRRYRPATNPAHPTYTYIYTLHQQWASLPSFSYIIQYRYKLSIDYVSVQTIPFSDVFSCQIRCKDILWETEWQYRWEKN